MVIDQEMRERFWAGAVADGTGCWPWQRGKSSRGYGHVRFAGNPVGAHRVAYMLVKGPIPEGLDIDHLCRNRRCINPGHLEAVTHRENHLLRGEGFIAQQARRTHCPEGHAYAGHNLIMDGQRRRCRICKNARTKASRHRYA